MEKLSSNQDSVFQRINSKVNIVDIVSHYIQLEKRGKNFVGLCPFHDDKNLGNFSVSPEKQFFKCFSCGEKGNAINFVQKYERISYLEAAKRVCEISGIDEPELNKVKKTVTNPKVEKALSALELLTSYYSLYLYKEEEARDGLTYLHNRGLNDEVISRFNVGFAPKDSEKVIKFLVTNKNYSYQELDYAGIVDYNNSNLKDKNAGRVVFPIRNKDNKVVGFSARIIDKNSSSAKYINTSETLVFHKSNILYNYYEAQNHARKCGYVYLLEGFMDVIACYRVGIYSAIALMGTALTKEHLKMIKELNVTVRLCLDLDSPGQKAMYQIIKVFEANNIPYELVNNDVSFNYKDSDEILSNLGENGLVSYLSKLVDKFTWVINFYKKTHNLDSFKEREGLLNRIKPMLIKLNPLEFEECVKKLSLITGFSTGAIIDTLNLKKLRESSKETSLNETKSEEIIEESEKEIPIYNEKETKRKLSSRNITRLKNLEHQIIGYIIHSEQARDYFISLYNYEFYDKEANEIFSAIKKYIKKKGENKIEINELLDEIDDTYLKTKVKKMFNLRMVEQYSNLIQSRLIEGCKEAKDALDRELLRQNEDTSDIEKVKLTINSQKKVVKENKALKEVKVYAKNR